MSRDRFVYYINYKKLEKNIYIIYIILEEYRERVSAESRGERSDRGSL